MNNGHSPHLTSNEVDTFHDGVRETVESNLMGATGVIGCVWLFLDPLIPVIAIAIESAYSMATDANIIASEDKGGRLILIPDREGVVQPILYIGTPLKDC